MIVDIISWGAVIALLATSAIMLISRDWRVTLGALAAQYIAAFWLETRHLPPVMSSVKLITGWMVVAILGITRLGLSNAGNENEETFLPRGRRFRAILIGIVSLSAGGAAARVEAAIPGIGLPVIAGSLLLIGAGVLHLGITSDLLRVTLALLSIFAGFEIIYAAVENSILAAGLLAASNLGLGLVGSYLLIAGSVAPEVEIGEEI